VPYLGFLLKLEMPRSPRASEAERRFRRLRRRLDTPAMATGETTVELLDACCRLVDR